jgi:hypothetical protein
VTGAGLLSFFAYDTTFTGGVTVAVVDGRIATGPGVGGGPDVRVFDGGRLLYRFDAFDPQFRGGVFLTATDGGSPRAAGTLVVAPGAGGVSQAVEFHLAGGGAFPQTGLNVFPLDFRGGTRLAAADLDGDGVDELVAAPGTGGGPLFLQFERTDESHIGTPTFLPAGGQLVFDPSFLGGVFVG